MKSVVSTLAVLTLLLSLSASAQQAKASNESLAVQNTIQDYISAYRAGDSARMEKSIHPQYLKHVISGTQGSLRMSQKTGLQMVEDIRGGGPQPTTQKDQISVLDISGDIASAKLVTPGWTDYVSLAKWNGEWKIVSVLLRENN